MKHFTILLMLSCIVLPCIAADEQTWIEIDGTVYGARPDDRGLIGGGNGYSNVTTKGDYTVSDLDALLDALSKAQAGHIIFIPED